MAAGAATLILLAAGSKVEAAAPSFKKALTFHASFDTATAVADFAKGDPALYNAPGLKATNRIAGLPASAYVTRPSDGGKFGGHLQFHKNSPEMIFFRAEKNFAYSTNGFAGTVSFWLNLTPDTDLAPGYTDPIQITSKQWDDAAFFVEFTRDEKPREFRLGAYADTKVWNPKNQPWDKMPFAEKPLLKVERPPFQRGQWTHVAFTFDRYNTGRANAPTRLYLNGEPAGEFTRLQTFTWNIADAKIMLGLSYIGGLDELSLFNKALTPREVKKLYSLKNGVTPILPRK